MSQRSFFHRHGIVIVMITVFFVPLAMRGSRMAIQRMRNEVQDWLPKGFSETKELDEFRRLFHGEGFVVVSWQGCTGKRDDARLRLFIEKLHPETPPSQRDKERIAESNDAGSNRFVDDDLESYVGKLDPRTTLGRQELIGNRLGLYVTGSYHQNWGGQNEKWLRGDGEKWYYLLPNGDLYRWSGTGDPVRSVLRWVMALGQGPVLHGEQVATLGPLDGPWYYQNPVRLESDLFKSCLTGPSLLYDLTKVGGVLEGDPETALRRLSGWLIGPDGEQTCLLLTLNERGRKSLHRVLGRGITGKPRGKLLALADECGLATPEKPSMWPPPLDRLFDRRESVDSGPMIRMGGPAVDNVAIDEEGQVTLIRLVGLSVGVGLLVAWFSFRSIGVVLMLSFVGMSSAQASLAFVGWSGSVLDAILMSMPSLIYVLALSGTVHLINYYRDTVIEEGFPGNPGYALRAGFSPLFLAAFTTALGLLSLVPSDIIPIRRFGIYSAIGVMFTLALIFAFVPAVLALWPPRSFIEQAQKRKTNPKADRLHTFWQSVGRFTIRHHGMVMITGVAITVVAAFGLCNVETSVQLMKLFDARSKLIRDYTWLEEHLGKLVPLELLVHVPSSQIRQRELEQADRQADDKFQLSLLDRLELGEHIRRSVEDHFGDQGASIVGTAMLANTFIPPLPEPGSSLVQGTYRGAFSRRLAVHRDELQTSDYLRILDDESEMWRISLRLGALSDTDYGRFVVSLKAAVEPVLAAYRYREEILRTVEQQRNGARSRGARVLLVGDKNQLQHSPDSVQENLGEVSWDKSSPESVRQDAIFLRTLASILKNSAITCILTTDAKVHEWFQQERVTVSDDSAPADWVVDCDCAVLATSDELCRKLLDDNGVTAQIDATDFRYDPSDEYGTAKAKRWPITVVYTGLVPVIYKAQRTLLNSLIESTWSAFLSIAVTMIFVLRSIPAGLVAMIPNLFPVIAVFGAMGYSQVKIDIGTMMTASIALGIAVDDTVHYLTWYRRALERGLDRHGAILDSFGRCASSMTETALIAGLGLSVFGFSTFTPTRRFGILMLVILVVGVIGELILTTALLAGPAGRVFEKLGKSRRPTVPKTADPHATLSEKSESKDSMRTSMTEERSALPGSPKYLRRAVDSKRSHLRHDEGCMD